MNRKTRRIDGLRADRGAAVGLMCATALTVVAGRPNIVFFNIDDLDFDEIAPYDYREFPSYTGARAAGYSTEGFPVPLWQNMAPLQPDERPDLHDPRVLTPHIERLANEGAMFTRFYITSPMCTPSRYTTLTGRLASRSPAVLENTPLARSVNIRWNTPIQPGESSLIKVLRQGGYATGMVGKWHNGAPPEARAPGILPDSDPLDPAVQAALVQANDFLVAYLENEIGFTRARNVFDGNKEGWSVPEVLKVHNLEWIVQGAVDFLDEFKEQPFFLYVSLPVPHGLLYGDWAEKYNICATPRGLLADPPSVMPSRQFIFERLDLLGIDHRNAMATWIDDAVGAVLNQLSAHGLDGNTVVVFISDHQARGKNTCYEGARVPCIVRWPGQVRPGRRIDALAANTDWCPTLLSLAGIDAVNLPDHDGRNLLPLLGGETERHHESVLLEAGHTRAVVTDRWKLILNRVEGAQVENPHVWERPPESLASAMAFEADLRAAGGAPRRVGWDGIVSAEYFKGVWFYPEYTFPAYFAADQLYDLHQDPFEQQNLIHNAEYAEIVQSLRDKLKGRLLFLPRPFGEFGCRENRNGAHHR